MKWDSNLQPKHDPSAVSLERNNNQIHWAIVQELKSTWGYSDDSLIRKSRLSGQKVREPISVSELMGDSVIWKTR